MSILIKGMEMPICRTCPCCEEKLYGNLCHITNEIVPFSFYRGDKCPLIELPPHGRLIDASVIDNMTTWDSDREYDKGWNSAVRRAQDRIADAPTIIEAEEEA